MRPGVKFSNGRELTADDVVYTITRVLDPATASPGAGFYLGIKGAQEFVDGKATSVEGIKAVDPQTVEFTLDDARCHVPEQDGAELRLYRAQGSGRGSGPGFRPPAGRHGPVYAQGVEIGRVPGL